MGRLATMTWLLPDEIGGADDPAAGRGEVHGLVEPVDQQDRAPGLGLGEHKRREVGGVERGHSAVMAVGRPCSSSATLR
jgi:hypothetical protein